MALDKLPNPNKPLTEIVEDALCSDIGFPIL